MDIAAIVKLITPCLPFLLTMGNKAAEGASQKVGEDVCKLYRQTYGTNIEIARFYNVYGPNEITEGEWAAVIGKWRGQIAEGKPITIVGDGEQRRDFTHIDDIVI
ncbi:MAG: Prochlorococcus phage [Cyanobacteriota bacterium]